MKKALRRLWNKACAGSALDIALLVSGVALVCVIVGGVVYLLLPSPAAQQLPASVPVSAPEDATFDKEEIVIDTTKYKEQVLAKTEDAGEAYLKDTLFLGDSNTARMLVYNGPVTAANSLGASSMGIQHVTSTPCMFFENYNNGKPVSVPQAVALMQPRRIVMCYGTNNAAWDTDTFIASYEKAVLAIQEAYPAADIIIASVPPVAKQRSYPNIKMSVISAFNQALVDLAKKLDVKFLDSMETLAGEDGFAKPEYMVSDGIHLSEAGMQALWGYVRTHAYETEDTRPPLKKVPRHIPTKDDFFGPAPVIVEKSSSSAASSSSSSTSSSSSSSSSSVSSSSSSVSSSSVSSSSSSASQSSSSSSQASSSVSGSSSAVACTHNYVETGNNKTFDCLDYTVTKECTLCKHTVTETVKATQAHQKDAGTVSGGYATYRCTLCGTVLETVLVCDHAATQTTLEATCQRGAVIVTACVCGQTYQETPVEGSEKVDHVYVDGKCKWCKAPLPAA